MLLARDPEVVVIGATDIPRTVPDQVAGFSNEPSYVYDSVLPGEVIVERLPLVEL